MRNFIALITALLTLFLFIGVGYGDSIDTAVESSYINEVVPEVELDLTPKQLRAILDYAKSIQKNPIKIGNFFENIRFLCAFNYCELKYDGGVLVVNVKEGE